jgi:hypothetical protein
MRNRPTLLRTEQNRTEQNRTEQRLTAPFLRPARRLKLNITFEMDDRRILMGLVYPVRFGGFCALEMRSDKDGM